MDKAYSSQSEASVYDLWEKSGALTPDLDKSKKPYSIILPLPNANDPMHMGHALFTIEDILIRFHRMLGDSTLWLPGGDHAGIETQYVFEKQLQKEGRSRFDFDRNTLYQMIWDFVEKNREINKFQMKKLGFSMDWTRYHYSLEPQIVGNVLKVFKKLYQDGLVYRDEKIVNYCTYCGTAFSNLEIDYQTVDSHLWYIKYGPLSVATTRPETMLGDTAVAVNPSDPRYQSLIGTTINLPLIGRKLPIIGDKSIDPEFGTGAVKVTPSHSPEDYDLAKKHHLEFIRIFDYDGKSNSQVPEIYRNLFPLELRKKVLQDLETQGLLEKKVPYSHVVGHCYRCSHLIEPITAPQWYVKIAPLATPALTAAKNGDVKFFPLRFKKSFIDWMENIRDWNISRQIVWGPRIPAWYCLDCHPNIKINFLDTDKKLITGLYSDLKDQYSFDDIKNGLQSLTAPVSAKFIVDNPSKCPSCQSHHLLQETDTFDTWFLSGQWPLNTLGFNIDDPAKSSPDFKYFYPTSVLDTLWDILFFWVARMIMFGLYLAHDVPFKTVHLHARCVDHKGQKMSKSKGNVIDPTIISEKYGTDALRMALVYGIAPASDFVISEDKIRAHRNFVNKIWNASRFVLMKLESFPDFSYTHHYPQASTLHQDDLAILTGLNSLINTTTRHLNGYRFGKAAEDLYQFFWHDFCDIYIEAVKNRSADVLPVLIYCLITELSLLHPFCPFVTESIYQVFRSKLHLSPDLLMTSPWPVVPNEK